MQKASTTGSEPEEQRQPPAVDQARDHVAAELVGAERIAGRADPAQPADHAALIRIGEAEIGREDRRERDQQDDGRAGDADRIARQAAEHARPVAARLVDGGDADEVVGDRAHRHASLDARVDRRLDHVDHEVEEHEEQREHQDRALQQRQVALEDRRVEQEAGAGPGEHGLDQDRAAEQVAELQAHHGDRGRRGVLRHMHEHALLGEALGAQRDDEFLAQQIADQRAHRARDDAHRDHRHRDGRQDQVLEVLPVPRPAARARRRPPAASRAAPRR